MDFTSSSSINDVFTASTIVELENAARCSVAGCIPLLPNRPTYLEIILQMSLNVSTNVRFNH